MIDSLRRYVHKQQFCPGLLGLLINPFYLARRELWREIAGVSHHLSGSLLDVGCGSKPYRSLFATDTYVGLDLDTSVARNRKVADAFYDGHRFPFENASFESVLCNQVLEHVFNPSEFLSEIHRVLVPSGRLLLTVPFVWDEHEQPYDYARYSSYGLRALFEQAGFRIILHRKLLANAAMLFQLINAYFYKITRTKSPKLDMLIAPIVFAPTSMVGLLFGACLPKNEDLFLDQLVLAEKIS